jgi:hypothetical protein
MSAVPSPLWPWPASWAPQWLDQRFNNGWTFGNVIVTTQNSSAPEVEREVVSRHSYGRQIGRLVEAVAVLAKQLPGAAGKPEVKALLALCEEVKQIKEAAKDRRQTELLDELNALKRSDPKGWADLMKAAGR